MKIVYASEGQDTSYGVPYKYGRFTNACYNLRVHIDQTGELYIVTSFDTNAGGVTPIAELDAQSLEYICQLELSVYVDKERSFALLFDAKRHILYAPGATMPFDTLRRLPIKFEGIAKQWQRDKKRTAVLNVGNVSFVLFANAYCVWCVTNHNEHVVVLSIEDIPDSCVHIGTQPPEGFQAVSPPSADAFFADIVHALVPDVYGNTEDASKQIPESARYVPAYATIKNRKYWVRLNWPDANGGRFSVDVRAHELLAPRCTALGSIDIGNMIAPLSRSIPCHSCPKPVELRPMHTVKVLNTSHYPVMQE